MADQYRTMAVLKVETDIITGITVNIIERVVILVIMYVETFKTDVISFIGNVIMGLMSWRPSISSSRVSSLTLIISLNKIKGKISKLPIKL